MTRPSYKRRAIRAPAVYGLALTISLWSVVARAGDDSLAEYKQWSERLAAAAKRHDAAEEVQCVTTIGRRWAWALNTLPTTLIAQAGRDSETARLGQARMEMLELLYESRWQCCNGIETSRWWLQLSLDFLEHNRQEESATVAAQITDPYALIGLQADNRYRRIAKSELVQRNILEATKKELERRRALAGQQPRNLSRVVQVGNTLMLLHRYEEVLSLTDAALHREDEAAAESSPYEDSQREFPWILDLRSHAEAALGRYDEAVALLRRACEESKPDLVSHCLNLALLLVALDRPQEALAAVPPLEAASAYGRAVAEGTRVRAFAELGDSERLAAALGKLRTYVDYPGLHERALIAAGRDDEAAEALAGRLSDPVLRTDALVEVQDYSDHPAPARIMQWRAKEKALRDRPEVRRAILAYGHIGDYPLPGLGF